MEQQTALIKAKSSMEHQSNMLVFSEQLKELAEKNRLSHEMVMEVQKHILAKDQISHEAQSKIDISKATNDKTPPELLNPED